MSRRENVDYFGRDVRVMDLRNVKEHAYEARAKLQSARTRAVQSLQSTSPTRRPATAAARPATSQNTSAAPLASANSAAVAELSSKVHNLEQALELMAQQFADQVTISASNCPYYAVSFGPGAIGMILMSTDMGTVEVAELRDDASGHPLLAKASGKIAVGDTVIAINHHVLSRYGTPTLEGVAAEFKSAPRPVTVLFQRRAAGTPTSVQL